MEHHIINIALAVLALVFSSCASRKDYVEDLAKQTAHNYIEWKYRPVDGIKFSSEDVLFTEMDNGNWIGHYNVHVICKSNPYGQKIEDADVHINYLMEYLGSEDRVVIRQQSIKETASLNKTPGELASAQARSWLKVYYSPNGEISYSNEKIIQKGDSVFWDADVVCHPQWVEGVDTTVREHVRIDMLYRPSSNDVVMEHQTYTEL